MKTTPSAATDDGAEEVAADDAPVISGEVRLAGPLTRLPEEAREALRRQMEILPTLPSHQIPLFLNGASIPGLDPTDARMVFGVGLAVKAAFDGERMKQDENRAQTSTTFERSADGAMKGSGLTPDAAVALANVPHLKSGDTHITGALSADKSSDILKATATKKDSKLVVVAKWVGGVATALLTAYLIYRFGWS